MARNALPAVALAASLLCGVARQVVPSDAHAAAARDAGGSGCICPDDDFEDGVLASFWEPSSNNGRLCGDAREEDGALVLEVSPCDPFDAMAEVHLSPAYLLCNDYELTVDYFLEDFGSPGTVRWFGVLVGAGDDRAVISRFRTVPGADICGPAPLDGVQLQAGNECEVVATTGDSGTFRILREAGTITVFHFDGATWTQGPSAAVPLEGWASPRLVTVLPNGATTGHLVRIERVTVTGDSCATAVTPATWGSIRAAYR